MVFKESVCDFIKLMINNYAHVTITCSVFHTNYCLISNYTIGTLIIFWSVLSTTCNYYI